MVLPRRGAALRQGFCVSSKQSAGLPLRRLLDCPCVAQEHEMQIAGEDINIRMTLLVFAVGLAGGLIAKLTGLPLPMLLGSVVAVGAISILGFEPGGAPPKVPAWLRLGVIPIIGLSIGAAFTPDVLREAKGWLPSLLSLVLFVPIAHYASYNFYRRVGGLSGPYRLFQRDAGRFHRGHPDGRRKRSGWRPLGGAPVSPADPHDHSRPARLRGTLGWRGRIGRRGDDAGRKGPSGHARGTGPGRRGPCWVLPRPPSSTSRPPR